MPSLREIADRTYDGDLSVEEAPPVTPLLRLEEVAPGVAFMSSFANVTAIETPEGLALVDTGSFLLAPMVRGAVHGWRARPLHTAVFTHGHVDHCFGVDLWEAADGNRARVYGHRNIVARFERYRRTRGWNSCINERQFQMTVEWPSTFRTPDVLMEDELVVEVGGERLELHHARGETDDHVWVYVPARKVLCTGDLFIWATPNAGNPQKVQRYALEWAQALRKMALLDVEVLCPGHGHPIFGATRVRRALDETAELLESLHDQTVAAMNEGATLDQVLQTVKAPAHLLARPYLRPIYDEPEFVVRNIYRLYGGWWDGDPANLKPAKAVEVAREVAALAGGASRLIERAQALSSAGDHRLACQLAEWASRAAPADAAVTKARAEIYEARAASETSLMARGVFRTAAKR